MKLVRFYHLFTKYGVTIITTMLIIGAISIGAAGWIYTHPPTTQITDQTNQKTIESSLSTHAVVTENTDVYSQGTTLRNQPVYLINMTPEATVTLETQLPSSTSEIDQHIELVYTATRNGEIFWKRVVPLRGQTTREKRTVTTQTNVSMPQILDQLNKYQSTFGEAATVSANIRISSKYDLDRYSGIITKSYPIESGSKWYSLPSDAISRTHSEPKTRTVQLKIHNSPLFLAPFISGIVFNIIGLLLAIVYYKRFQQRSAADLETAVHHNRYQEWISEGFLPDEELGMNVQINSLEGLVDIAIDTGERVIYDPNRNRYAVLHEQTGYYYTPQESELYSLFRI